MDLPNNYFNKFILFEKKDISHISNNKELFGADIYEK